MDKFRLKEFGGPDEGSAEDAVKCLTELQARAVKAEATLRESMRLTDGQGQTILLKAEDVGLHESATPAEIAKEAKRNVVENSDLKVRLTNALATIQKNHDAVKSMERMKAESIVDEAIRKQYLDAVERDHAITMYQKEPVATQEWINARSYKAILSRELGSGGEIEDLSPLEEVTIKAKELMKADSNLKFGEAQSKVLSSDPELRARYDAIYVAGKGGAR